jgi:deoxyribonuclease-2
VDWWFTYIHPDGLAHAYYDSSDRTGAFHVFENEPTTGAFGQTIAALYAGKAAGDVAWVTYNDELRGGGAREQQQQQQRRRRANASTSEMSAHAKGALLTNGTAGFWLVHSVPKLLDVGASEFRWGAAKTYGQSMLCLSLGAAGVEIAATQLTQMALHASLNSASSVPSGLQSRFPRIVALLNGEEPAQAAGGAQITTLGGTSFTSFAKRGSWGKDLYEDLVQPQLGINMAWETWRRSPYLESFCKVGGYAYDSVNVEYISLFPGEASFHYTKDHAKWGITLPADEGSS